MIKFVLSEEKQTTLVFGYVEEDQFFVDDDGDLCQKSSEDSYTTVADQDGRPSAYTVKYVNYDHKISKILPKVAKIEFGDSK